MLVAPLGDFAAFQRRGIRGSLDATLAPRRRRETAAICPNTAFSPFSAQVVEIGVHHCAGSGDALRLGQDVEMEMCGPARGGSALRARSCGESSQRNRAWSLGCSPDSGSRLLRKMDGGSERSRVDLPPRNGLRDPSEVAHLSRPLCSITACGLRLDVCVITRVIVGEEPTVCKNRIDRLAKKSRSGSMKEADGLCGRGTRTFGRHDSGWAGIDRCSLRGEGPPVNGKSRRSPAGVRTGGRDMLFCEARAPSS